MSIFPDDVKDYLLGSYLSGNTFLYFKPNDGYYKIDLESGEKELLFTNQLENGRSIIFNEDHIVEFNFYYGSVPSEKYLKYYNGEKWLDVKLPKKLEEFDVSNVFSARAVASDRIFMVKNDYSTYNGNSSLYYFKIDSDKPELILCDTVGDVLEEDNKEEESTEDDKKTDGYIDIEDIVVFDTANYLVKITGVDLHYDDPETKNKVEDYYVIKFYYENNTSKKYGFSSVDATVNGLMYSPQTSSDLEANQTGKFIICLEDEAREQFHVPMLYTREEYTDIYFQFKINDNQKMVHIYPYGEKNATQYVREPQDTDKVLIEDDEIKITFVGYDTRVIDNDTVVFYVENKVEDTIELSVTESTTVNGKSISSSTLNHNLFKVLGNSCALISFELQDEVDTLTEIEKYEIGYWKVNSNKNTNSYLDKIILEP